MALLRFGGHFAGFYPMMTHFYPGPNAPIHRAQGVNEWFGDVNRMLWPSQPPDLNLDEQL